MPAPESISSLVRHFQSNLEDYRNPHYNETQLRQEFINPFFTALGWDVNNTAGAAEAYKPVVHEDAVKVSGATKAPDYSFRIGGTRKFFVETKKPAVKIAESGESAFQLRRYAWSAKLSLSILTDFDEFAVYDCRVKPAHTDKASAARIMLLPYTDYLPRWEELCNIFSPEAITRGSFDRYAETEKLKKGTARVDDAFLSEIERWRDELARSIAVRNPSLSVRELNFAVQRIIDRIVFLRICEDRGVEEYGRLQALLNGGRVYPRLVELFLEADQRYNSGLFHFRPEKDRPEPPDELTTGLKIDDKALKDILKNLYYPDSPYEFSVFSADILGQVYEQFLGKVIRLTAGHHAVVENKPEVKKAGGVYYTPVYIVEYIVKNTVGKLLSGKTLRSMKQAPIRILDPACGSGSFLIQAYQYLLDWYGEKYVADGAQKHGKEVYRGAAGVWRLSTAERKRILLAHIYGVDIDPQAVEVTKLSLLLKVLEGENYESLNRQMAMFHERALPDLGGNIKCGNSLIGSDYFAGRAGEILHLPDENMDDEYRRINPFDWNAEFKEIMRGGGISPPEAGFDAVIGNPPYGAEFDKIQKDYLAKAFESNTRDSAAYFLEKASLLSKRRFSMIVPKSISFYKEWAYIRDYLLSTSFLCCVCDVGMGFEKVNYEEVIVCFDKLKKQSKTQISIAEPIRRFIDPKNIRDDGETTSEILDIAKVILFRGLSNVEVSLLKKINKNSIELGDICLVSFRGLYISDKDKNELKRGRVKFINKVPDVKRYFIERIWNINIDSDDIWINKANKCKGEKIFFKVLRGKRIIAYPDIEGDLIPTEKLVIFKIDAEKSSISHVALAGIINSKVPSYYIQRILFSKTTETSRVMDLIYTKYIPLPRINFSDPADVARHHQMVSLVETMLSLHKKLPAARTPEDKTILQKQIDTTDRQIDALVYELYGLTDEEARVVEGG